MRNDPFWNQHYTNFAEQAASAFCQYCVTRVLQPTDTVVELGCGNGRDGVELARHADRYIGLDTCPTAIAACASALKRQEWPEERASALLNNGASFAFDATPVQKRLAVYSRFSLHSMTYAEQASLLERLSNLKSVPWVCMVEARTIYDDLYGVGERIGPHEFVTDHYRRFIDPKSLLATLSTSFEVRYFELSRGFAVYKSEDPMVMRVVFSGRSE